MSLIRKSTILLLLTLCSSLFAESNETLKVSGQLRAYLQNIDIEGGSDVTDREGLTHYEELGVNLVSKSAQEGEVGLNLRLRGTNDERVQKDDAQLLYFRSYYRDKSWNIEAGDVASSFNPYVFSGSLKGAKFAYRSTKKRDTFHYALISGIKKASWRDLYTEDKEEELTAYVGAAEVKYVHERAKELKMTLSIYEDDIDSGGSLNNQNGKKGYSVGLDGKWRFSKYVTLKGYGAYINGTDDVKNDKADEESSAITLKLLTRPLLRSVKSNFSYQRISAKYIPFGAVAVSDKEQLENMTTWRINREYRARLELKVRHDNVENDDLNETQYIYYERVSLAYTPSFIKRTIVDLRVANKDVDGRGVDSNTQIVGIDMTLRDKSGWRYGVGYEYSHFQDDLNTTVKSQYTNNYRALLGYKQRVSPESYYRFTARVNYRTVSHSQDTIGMKIDAGYTYNKRVSADLLYMLNNTDREANNNTKNNTYQLRATYKLDDRGRDMLRLLLEKRDVTVDNTPLSSYDEYIQKISLVMNF